jgi:hypothetical protein
MLCVLDTDAHAKAGLMARWGNEPDAPFALVNAFPDGSVAMCSRKSKGAVAVEKHLQTGSAPDLELRLTVNNGQAAAFFRHGGELWHTIATAAVPVDPSFDQGYAVCAHRDAGFTVARFAPSGHTAAPVHSSEILLPDDWQTSGSWKRSSDGAATVFTADATGRLWQDVTVDPAKRYRFTAAFSGDSTPTTNPSRLVELRLEGTIDDQPVALNAATLAVAPSMSVTGTSIGNRIRFVIISPAQGKITLHRASLADLSSANDACAAQ